MYNLWKENWSWGIHHTICGLVPLPAVCGFGGSWSFVATRHTGSLELGFEIYDTISKIHERYFSKDGHKTMPLKVFILTLFHHCVSFTMIIPCNMSRAGE